jgi:hypothetical protein
MTNIIKILEEAAMSGPHVVVVTEPDSGFKIAIGSYPDGYAARDSIAGHRRLWREELDNEDVEMEIMALVPPEEK